MNLDNTSKEEDVIKVLENAFKLCGKLGLRFAVMNDELMFANKRLYIEAKKHQDKYARSSNGAYTVIGYCQDVDNLIQTNVNTHKTMDSCGGW